MARKGRHHNTRNQGKFTKLSDEKSDLELELEPESSRYQYWPLESPRHIRLVQVRGSLIGNRITARFTHVSLDQLPTGRRKGYRCISYRWGTSDCVDRVWLQNSYTNAQREASSQPSYLPITRSAASVLRYLIRARIRGFIWIDALCIDQTNAREKSVQVPLMRDIYGAAKMVVAYLGEKDGDSDLAMGFIRLLAKKFKKTDFRRYNESQMAEFEGEYQEDDLARLRLGKGANEKWKALFNLLQRPWFERLWIVQEVVLARSAVVVCGKKMVPWEMLTEVVDVLRDSSMDYLLRQRDGDDRDGRIPKHPVGIHCLLSIAWILNSKRVMLPQGLQRLLLRFRSFAATDPRDFIFALLGIADTSGYDWIKADYEESLEAVFESWTRHLIGRENEVRLLHIAGIGQPRSELNLPSWVPDWSCRSRIHQDVETTVFGDVDPGIRYQASRGTKLTVRHNVGPGCISLTGRIIDTVDTCTEIPNLYQSDLSLPPRSTLMQRDRFLKDLNRLAQSIWFHKKEERQWRTLIANRLGDKITPKGLCAEMGNQYMRWHRSDLKYYRAIDEDSNHEMGFEIWERERQHVDDIVRHRRFIKALPNAGERAVLTTKAGYVGIGPRKLQAGDRVCIFYGASTPFILRPVPVNAADQQREARSMKYLLVGECYFDELMTGLGLSMGVAKQIVLC